MAEPSKSASNQAATVVRQLKDLWHKQPKGRRTLAVVIVLGVLGFVGLTSLTKHVESWSSAADGISPDEAQQLYATLIGRGVAARLREGNKVEVHDADVDQAHAIAATSGLVTAGKGLETFEGSTLGQSSFAEQVNYRRALQTELARSIDSIGQVESARVNVAFGKKSVFKDQESPAKASVMVRLRSGQALTPDEVKGIRQLVAASVDGMKAEDVAVIDNHGHPLDAAEHTAGTAQADVEHAIDDNVRKILETVVGKGHVSVVSNAEVDTRKISQTEDLYDKDNTAIRSQAKTVDGTPPGVGSTSGVAGTQGNLPGATPASTGPSSPGSGKLQETINYEVSHKVVQTTNPDQTLRKLHVAVLVDQAKDAAGKPVVRTKEQSAELLALARQAAGIDDARGDTIELQSVSFAPEEDAMPAAAAPASALPPMPVLVGAGAGALVLLVVIALVLRKVLKKKSQTTALVKQGQLAFPTPIAELERVLDARPHHELPNERELPGLPAGRSVQDRVMETVRGDVERAAGVLTAWLHEPAPKGAK